jgi:hypothetical protein
MPPNVNNNPPNMPGRFIVGLPHHDYLDLICLIILAFIGIIIKISFGGQSTPSENTGHASSTIWGYGLTAISLSILVFMGLHLSTNANANGSLRMIMYILPIALTLVIILYTIYLNFLYFARINSNKVSAEYNTYSGMSVFLIIVQLLCIARYLYSNLTKSPAGQIPATSITTMDLYRSATYFLCTINFIFLLMMHINLEAFSTDG